MEQKEEQTKKMGKEVAWRTVAVAALIFVAAYFTIIGLAFYFSPTLTGKIDQSKIMQKTIRLVPYPVAMVGGKFITGRRLLTNLASVQKFYENQDFSKVGMRVDFSTADGKKRLEMKGGEIFSKLIDDTVIQAEAQKKGISLTPDIIDQEVDRMLKEYGTGETLKNDLEKLYGWKLNDFKENIVKPDLYREKLASYIQENDPTFVAAKKKIGAAQSDLKNGMSFTDAVKKHSEGESVKDFGALGWFSADQMLPEVAVPAFQLNIGQQSEIIRSGVGYHIVRVEDKKVEDGVNMVKVSQIFVRTKLFSDWLAEVERSYHIALFSREFRWNSQSQSVEFRAREMRDYENDMRKNPPNDPSVIF